MSSTKDDNSHGARQQRLPLSWDGDEEAKPEPAEHPAATDAAPAAPAVTEPEPTEAVKVLELGRVDLSIGQTLMEARGACNLTVAQAAQKTRIPKNVIDAFETDGFERLPPPVYARSHLLQLCRAYGIDSESLLTEFDALVGTESGRQAPGRLVMGSKETESGARVQYHLGGQHPELQKARTWSPTMFLVGAAILTLIAIVVTAFVLWQVRQYRGGAAGPNDGNAAGSHPAVDLEEFVIPQQLPLRELPIPEP